MTAVIEETLAEAAAAGRHVMCELNQEGDTRITWDPSSEPEVKAARKHFDRLRRGGYIAYRAEGADGEQGELLREFDPAAQHIILVKQLVGG